MASFKNALLELRDFSSAERSGTREHLGERESEKERELSVVTNPQLTSCRACWRDAMLPPVINGGL